MGNLLTLALYLATKARSDRAARRALARGGDAPDTIESELLGMASEARPKGDLIWFHTGADRHGLSARELALRMHAELDDLHILLTTGAKRRKPSEGNLLSQHAPDDDLPSVRRFLDAWTPNIAIWTEPDLRPALITEAADRSIPLFLVDAHTARPDPQAWRWFRGMSGSLLGRFERVLTGDNENAVALRRLGAEPGKLDVVGYLEEGTPALSCNEAERDSLAQELGARPVWLAAHIRPDECEAVIQAHSHALLRAHRLLLILVPDDPDEGADMAAGLSADGYRVALRSTGEEPNSETQIYVADTEEEMGLWLRLAPISFLGRSMAVAGGTNPYEAAALGSAIIHGPNVQNFRQAYAKLGVTGATRLVRKPDDLADAVVALLSPDVAAKMAHAAWQVCSSGAEVTDQVKDLIFANLDAQEIA